MKSTYHLSATINPAFILWWAFWMSIIFSGVKLAIWQWERGIQKEENIKQLQSSRFEFPKDNILPNYSRVKLKGRWVVDSSVWWDNKIHKGNVGVALLTLFLDENNKTWIVNRGFFSTQGSRLQIPIPNTINKMITIEGVWQSLEKQPPVYGVNREGNRIQNVTHDVWPNFNSNELGVIHQSTGPGLLIPFWQPRANAAERHYGYCMQWIFLTITALFFGLRYSPAGLNKNKSSQAVASRLSKNEQYIDSMHKVSAYQKPNNK